MMTSNKMAVEKYYDNLSRQSPYIQKIEELVKASENYMDERVCDYKTNALKTKLAIVLDVDDTSISNYFSILRAGFANDDLSIYFRYHNLSLPPIDPIQRLFNKAIANGIAVFFVSARKAIFQYENFKPLLTQMLTQAGYHNWQDIYLPMLEDFTMSPADYKMKMRQHITEQGYRIILNIGDQDSDVTGNYTECHVKLPNLLYGNENAFFKKVNVENQKKEEAHAITNFECRRS